MVSLLFGGERRRQRVLALLAALLVLLLLLACGDDGWSTYNGDDTVDLSTPAPAATP